MKGVLTAEDARLACEHGAAGIVVSNHGGRQLDGVAATIDALPEVVEAVDGRVEVLLDGGIRRGADVVKALALGARACLAGRAPLWGLVVDGGIRRGSDVIKALALGAHATLAGRPFIWGLAAAGEDGVFAVLELLRAELELGLALLGCRSPAEVSAAHVRSL